MKTILRTRSTKEERARDYSNNLVIVRTLDFERKLSWIWARAAMGRDSIDPASKHNIHRNEEALVSDLTLSWSSFNIPNFITINRSKKRASDRPLAQKPIIDEK